VSALEGKHNKLFLIMSKLQFHLPYNIASHNNPLTPNYAPSCQCTRKFVQVSSINRHLQGDMKYKEISNKRVQLTYTTLIIKNCS